MSGPFRLGDDMFPKASKAFKLANPVIFDLAQTKIDKVCPEKPVVKRDKMNKTEREFSFILEAQKRAGEIRRWDFQSIRLQWGFDEETKEAMWYKPDFVAWPSAFNVHDLARVIEVKGPHIWDRDVVRFKGCRAFWQNEFRFEMWQRTPAGAWNRLH